MSMIRTHLCNTGTTANYSLKQAGRPTHNISIGTPIYVPINQNSYSVPNNVAPYAISEWRGYTHSASGTCSTSTFTTIDIDLQTYTYYKIKLTGGQGYTSSISVQAPSSSATETYFAAFYTAYPFTTTGGLTGTPWYIYGFTNDTSTKIQVYTMSSAADVFFHIVLYKTLV